MESLYTPFVGSPGLKFDPSPGHDPASHALETLCFDPISTCLDLPGKSRPSPRFPIHSNLAKWGFIPHFAKFEWIFAGGAAGARGDMPPKWPETGVIWLYMSGAVYI